MIRAVLIMAFFNVHTGTTGDFIVQKNFTSFKACAEAMISTGPQVPDKDGNVRLYECLVPGRIPSAKAVEL